jgi:transposase InsO family protein
MGLTMVARRQVTATQVEKYAKATRVEKAAILDHLCAVTGWHRDHARKALREAAAGAPAARKRRDPVLVYGAEVVEALTACWAALDGPSGKILQPALPGLVTNLRGNGHLTISDDVAAAVTAMSAATIDRRLAPARAQLQVPGKGRSWTRPGSLLKSSIPLKTWAEWDDTVPGFAEIDLVGHDGGDNNGQFCWTLCLTDVASTWVDARTIRSKGEKTVSAALEELQLALPFHLAGLHSDNGSEFINHHLLRWCTTRHITFTRGRPSHSNDNAHIEQKNWSIVRRCVGYYRYDTAREVELLNRLWATELPVVNLFKPQQKLLTKTRHGARVTKTYGPAITPLDRLLTRWPDLIDPHDLDALLTRHARLDVVAARRDVAALQDQLTWLAKRRGPTPNRPNRHHVYDSRTKLDRPARTRAADPARPTTSTPHDPHPTGQCGVVLTGVKATP